MVEPLPLPHFRSHCKIKSAHFQYEAYWLVLIGWEGRTHFLQYAWRQKCALFFEIIPGQKVCLETFYQEIDINKKVCTSKYFILFTINSKLFCLFFLLFQELEIRQHSNLLQEVTTGITFNESYVVKQVVLRELRLCSLFSGFYLESDMLTNAISREH